MRRLSCLSSLVLGVLVLGSCSSDDEAARPPGEPVEGEGPGGDGLPGAAPRPSGGRIRVFNAYVPLDGSEPGPIDVYAPKLAFDGEEPRVTVPFGELSELFDPMVLGDKDAFSLSFFWHGTTGLDNALMSAYQEVHPGDVGTYFFLPGETTQKGGRRLGALTGFDHEPRPGSLGAEHAQIPEGKGLVTVDSRGIEQVLSKAAEMRWFFSVGGGCAKSTRDNDFSLAGVGPGTAAAYALAPGEHTGTIYDDEDCEARPVATTTFTVKEGVHSILFLYAPKDGDVRTVVVPLEPKTP